MLSLMRLGIIDWKSKEYNIFLAIVAYFKEILVFETRNEARRKRVFELDKEIVDYLLEVLNIP